MDKSPPVLSNLVYRIMALEYKNILNRGDWFDFLVNVGNFYPPLPFQITSIFTNVWGINPVTITLSQSIFWAILIFSTYFLGSLVFGEEIGFYSSLLSISIPQVQYFMKNVGVDIPIAAFVPLTLYFLFKSDKFKNTKYSILFFISLGLGMLLKWAFIIYVGFAVIYLIGTTLYQHLKEPTHRKETISAILGMLVFMIIYYVALKMLHGYNGKMEWASLLEIFYFSFVFLCAILIVLTNRLKIVPIRNITRGFFIFLLLTAHFVVVHLISMREIYKIWFWDVQYNLLLPVRTPYHFFVEFLIYVNFGVLMFGILVGGIALYVIDFHKLNNTAKQGWLLLASLLFALLILYIQPVYDARYYVPFAGISSIFMAYFLFKITKPIKREYMAKAFVFLILLYYTVGGSFYHLPFGKYMGRVTGKPYVSVNQIPEAASYILRQYREGKGSLLIMFRDTSSSSQIAPLLMLYYLRKEKKPNEMVALIYKGADPIFPEKKDLWGIYIDQSYDDDEDINEDEFFSKDVEKEKGTTPTKILDKLELYGFKKVRPSRTIIAHIRDTSTPPQNPFPNLSGKYILSMQILKNTSLDLYKNNR